MDCCDYVADCSIQNQIMRSNTRSCCQQSFMLSSSWLKMLFKRIFMTPQITSEVFSGRNNGILDWETVWGSVKAIGFKCREQRAGVSQPFMADLPRERLLERVYSFTNTGVEYFDPFDVKFMRKTMKRWCCLFTCLTTRAVRIEDDPSLVSETCLTAIIRFIAR